MKMVRMFFGVLVFFSLSASASEDARIFSPARGVTAEVAIDGAALTWKAHYDGGNNQGYARVDAEKRLHLDVGDYDFSGRSGFAVWHIDDGMGTYSIYRIFTFSPLINKFVERIPASLCGDEFVDLKVDKKSVALLAHFGIETSLKRALLDYQYLSKSDVKSNLGLAVFYFSDLNQLLFLMRIAVPRWVSHFEGYWDVDRLPGKNCQ